MAYYYNGQWNVNPQGASPENQYNTLSNYLTQGIPTLTGGSQTRGKLDELYANPLGSPLFKNTINALLAAMAPSEQRSRRSLADTFRQSGQMQSGAFAESARMQENDILGKRNEVVASHAGSIYEQLLKSLRLNLEAEQAAGDPYKLGTNLLGQMPYPQSYYTGGGYGGGRGGGVVNTGGGFGGFGSAEDNINRANQQWTQMQARLHPSSNTPAPSPIGYQPLPVDPWADDNSEEPDWTEWYTGLGGE